MKALSIKNLTKTYANGNRALKGIDLAVEEGDFYALLGPNGAGKTTAIGIICGLVQRGRTTCKTTQDSNQYEPDTRQRDTWIHSF